MHKAWLALVFGGVAAAVGLAAKTIADKKKPQRFEAEMRTLYNHLHKKIIIDNITDPNGFGKVLEENELWDGELDAIVYTVGCYSVRIANRAYRKTEYVEKHGYRPATREELIEIRNGDPAKIRLLWGGYLFGGVIVRDVFAAYIGEGKPNDYRYICHVRCPQSCIFPESITFIATVKNSRFEPDACADLFVRCFYMGSSCTSEEWYAFSKDGCIKRYRIDGYSVDSDNAKWDWKG